MEFYHRSRSSYDLPLGTSGSPQSFLSSWSNKSHSTASPHRMSSPVSDLLLNVLQFVNVFCVLGSPEQGTVSWQGLASAESRHLLAMLLFTQTRMPLTLNTARSTLSCSAPPGPFPQSCPSWAVPAWVAARGPAFPGQHLAFVPFHKVPASSIPKCCLGASGWKHLNRTSEIY